LTPAELVEIERIRQLKARYFRLMDQKQWDEWSRVLCEDVVVDTTEDGSPLIRGRQAFRDFLVPILDGVATVHHGHTPEIELTSATTATGIWAMEDNLWWPADRGGRHLRGSGWYHEEYRKEMDGEWRIQSLTLRRIRTEVDGKRLFPKH